MTDCRGLRDDLRRRVSVVAGDMWNSVPIQLVVDQVVKEGVSLHGGTLVALRRIRPQAPAIARSRCSNAKGNSREKQSRRSPTR